MKIKKCLDRGSNAGPSDLQSDALPTELSRLEYSARELHVLKLCAKILKTLKSHFLRSFLCQIDEIASSAIFNEKSG